MRLRSRLTDVAGCLCAALLVCVLEGCGASTTTTHQRPRLGEAMDRSAQGAENDDTAAPAPAATPPSQTRTRTPDDDDSTPADSTRAAPGGASAASGPVSGIRSDQPESGDPVAGAADVLVGSLVGAPTEPGAAVAPGTPPGGSGVAPGDAAPTRTHLLLGASIEAPAGSQFDPSPAGRAGVGLYVSERARFTLAASYTGLRRTEGSQTDRALSDAWELAGEGTLKLYLARSHTMMGLYGMGGLRVGLFHWDYETAIEVTNEDGSISRIESDDLIVLAPYLGAGISLLQTPRFHLGASAAWGLRLHAEETEEGFVNDVFSDVGFTQLGLELLVFL
jgi:hypothetical protein